MKILHITTHFYPFVGGLENLVFDIATEQAKQHEVIVLTLKHDKTLPDFEEKNGIKIYRHSAISVIKNRYLLPRFGFQKKIKEINPDVLFTHTRFFATSYLGQTTKINCAKIHVEHGHNFVQSKNFIIKTGAWLFDHFLGKKVFHNCDKIVVLSEKGTDFVQNLMGKKNKKSFAPKIQIIQNGVRFSEFLQVPPRKNYAIFFGRLILEKGLEEIIYTAHKNPNWKFFLYGTGETLTQNIPKNVVFGGQVLPKEIPAKIQQADLVILPSWSEGASLAVLEAAANKRPILATPVGQNTQIISAQFLVPVRCANKLSEKVRDLTDQFEIMESEGAKIRKIVQEKYSFKQMIKSYDKLINKVK